MAVTTYLRALLSSVRPGAVFLLGASCLAVAGNALAQDPNASCANQATSGFTALGAIFGYFLTYSIRYGSKTQDVFKSFVGAIGAGGGAATTLLVSEACRFPLLVSYGVGTVLGLEAFCVLAVFLAGLYSVSFDVTKVFDGEKVPTGWALFAETLAKVLLGEDFRPPPSKTPWPPPSKTP